MNDVLADLAADFSSAYSAQGRPLIAPEKLLRGFLLLAFYENPQLMQQRDFNLPYRWFVGLEIDDEV